MPSDMVDVGKAFLPTGTDPVGERVMAGPDVASNPSGLAANLPQRPNVSKARRRRVERRGVQNLPPFPVLAKRASLCAYVRDLRLHNK